MSRMNDSFTPGGLGILVPQDHGDLSKGDKLHFRGLTAGVRVTDRLPARDGGNWVEDEETRGDYSGFFYWDRAPKSRPVGSWREVFPVVVPRKGPTTGGSGPAGEITGGSRRPFGEAAGVLDKPITGTGKNTGGSGGGGFDMVPAPAGGVFPEPRVYGFPILGESFDDDRRYERKDLIFPTGLGGAEVWPALPGGGVTLAVAGTSESSQQELFVSADPRLVAPHMGGSPFHGSFVADVTPDGDFDDARTARLQSLVRVIKDPHGGWSWSGGDENTLALNIGKTGLGEANGGLVVDAFDAQIRLGHLSVRDGGFLDAGGGLDDKHVYAHDGDGNAIHPAHLSGLALWRIHDNDGPMLFERDPYVLPNSYPYLAYTYLRWDRGAPYQLPRDAPSRTYAGMWRWETEVPIGSTEEPQVPLPTPGIPTPTGEPPPEITPGGGPPTGGGGGGGVPTGGGGGNFGVADGSYVGGNSGGGGISGTTIYPNDGLGIDAGAPPLLPPWTPTGAPSPGGAGGGFYFPPPRLPFPPTGVPPEDSGSGVGGNPDPPPGSPAHPGRGGGGGPPPGTDRDDDDGPRGGSGDGGTPPSNPYRKGRVVWGPSGWEPGPSYEPGSGDSNPEDPSHGGKPKPDKPPRIKKTPKPGGPPPIPFPRPPLRGARWDPRGFWAPESSRRGVVRVIDDENNLDAPRHTLLTHREIAFPGWAVKPQFIRQGELDMRYTTRPGYDGLFRLYDDSPVTLRIEGYGQQQPGGTDWVYTQTPGASRSRGGIGLGGVAFLQPGQDMSDSLSSFANASASLSHLVVGPGVALSLGTPDTTTGGILNGIAMTHDGSGDMSWAKYDASGVATADILKLTSGGALTAAGKVTAASLGTTQTETYSVTNAVTSRSYDAPTVTVAELADVLGTLIDDLRNGKLPA